MSKVFFANTVRFVRRLMLLSMVLLLHTQSASAQWDFVLVDEGIKPAIALGPDCTAEVSYMTEANNGYIRHAQIAPGGMPVISFVDEGYFYGPLDVATSATGDVFISYHDHDVEDQIVAVRSRDNWTLEQVVNDGHDGWDNNVMVTADGVVHTSSIDPSNFGGRGVEYARRSTGGFWTVQGAGSPPLMYANATSIIMGSNGEPAIAYYNDTTRNLELTERSAGLWSTSIVDSVGIVGRFPSLAIDGFGDLHVAYYLLTSFNAGVIRYAKRQGTTWTTSDVDILTDVQIGNSGARRTVALEVEDTGALHIAYGDASVIRYAKGAPGNWTYQTVQEASTAGNELGQMVDMARCTNDGLLHIVYYTKSAAADEIWYARPLEPVGIEDIRVATDLRVEVYPNPSAAGVNIKVEGEMLSRHGPFTLEIIDVLGRTVFSRKMRAADGLNTSVPVRGLASGTYMVQIQDGDKVQTSSFVVTR